ncbi:hypothetical protein BD289DRAFT_450701 [Coniella lustricola]|uniref:Uncharacterized protein n=1 Tax=Coniella lustricola TaxID=2025994 RepID=A0A2T3AHM3_9PEZI|nr:hypothetical protein BD289DRAFT_450701 [Coniella lustricola]
MPVFDARDIVSWPGGDNSTDTVIGNVHLNLSALEHWNYTLYSNGTMSNGSNGWCLLTFAPYEPAYVFANGSFVNMTSCYSPVKAAGARAFAGIGLAVVYAICLMFTLINLTKHGRMYLPSEKRFRPVGRRWQWYWMIAMSVTGFISLVMNIDVDRYYLPQIPIVITAFFWMLLNLCTMASVWEAVRHWGSWMERQYVDPDPFALAMDDKRAKFEFWVPLFFYLFWWLDFFLVIPRNWGRIELQRSTQQTLAMAAPSATDGRFKSACFLLFVCWLTIAYHLRHSIKHYRERNRGVVNRTIGLIKFTPYRFQLIVPLALAVVAFQGLAAWEFQYSVFDVTGNRISMFVGGYGPALLIMIIQIVAGFANPNEDKELIRQRRIRGAAADRELGLVKKPAWWKRRQDESMRARIARNVREVGGGRATAANIDRTFETRTRETESENNANIEMGQMSPTTTTSDGDAAHRPSMPPYSGRSDTRRSERTVQHVAGLLFPNAESSTMTQTERLNYLMSDGPPPPPYAGNAAAQRDGDRGRVPSAGRPITAERSQSTNTTNSITSPPQQIKSMLDV